MNDKPRFEIIEQIGHGQFSNVYKARWVNVPIINFNSAPSCPPSPIVEFQNTTLNPFLDGYNQAQQLITTCNNDNNINVDKISSSSSSTTPSVASFGEKYVALKKIKFYDIQNSKLRMDCLKEVKLLQQLKHPNIINYNISFIERNELFIVLELADGGDLSKLIRYFQKRKQLISERIILKYFTQVCSAVRYIHSKRILHRDIKPANIFMTSNGCVKLGDFGLGRFFSQNTLNAHSIVGTFYYMSPERIRETGYSFSSDVWSLGCVLYELITLNSPFSVLTIDQQQLNTNNNNNNNNDNQRKQPQQQQTTFNLQWLIDRICRAEYPSLESYFSISLRLRQLTAECLNPIPDARPNMDCMCAIVDDAYQAQQLQLRLQQQSNQNLVSPAVPNHHQNGAIRTSHQHNHHASKRHPNNNGSINQTCLIDNNNNNNNNNRQRI